MKICNINYSVVHEVGFIYCEDSDAKSIAETFRKIHDGVKLIHVYEEVEAFTSQVQEPESKYKYSLVRAGQDTWSRFTDQHEAILKYDRLLCQNCGENTEVGESFCEACKSKGCDQY